MKKTAAIVFSGGGLRGFAQFGAYKIIEEFLKKNNVELKVVAGTSFGSITSSFISKGYSADDLISLARKNWSKLFSLIDIRFLRGPGVLKGDKFKKFFSVNLENSKFSDTLIDLRLNAVDLKSRKEMILSKDGLKSLDGKICFKKDFPLNFGIQISCSIPFVFHPVKYEDLLLVDGGVTTPLALNLINLAEYDYVFAIDTVMANFNFLDEKKVTKRKIVAQTISIAQEQYHFKKVDEYLKKYKNLTLIRPKVGPVKIRRKGELERMIKTGILEAKKELRF